MNHKKAIENLLPEFANKLINEDNPINRTMGGINCKNWVFDDSKGLTVQTKTDGNLEFEVTMIFSCGLDAAENLPQSHFLESTVNANCCRNNDNWEVENYRVIGVLPIPIDNLGI